MNIFFSLFIIFFKIGFVSFGGGYAMIVMIEQEFLKHNIIIDADVSANVIAIASSSPGPVGINLAVGFGYASAGIAGVIVSILSVSIPSLILVVLIAMFFNKINKHKIFSNVILIVNPVVAAIIIYAGLVFALKNNIIFFGNIINIKSITICIVALFVLIKTNLHPIFLIIAGMILGLFFF